MNLKVILLTGGASGIGLETAKLLMDENIRVYSASRRVAAAQKSENGGGEIIPVRMDVNSENEINSVISRILEENHRLDAVICNAGNGVAGSVEDTNMDEIRYQFETNFFGAVKTIKACLPVFRQQKNGRIMAISSLGAITPLPFQSFYSAGKAALSIFMQSLSIEVKPFGIQCCTILPGNVKTRFTSSRKYAECSACEDSAYYARMKKSLGSMERDEINGMEASFIAKKIVKQLKKKRMKEINIPGVTCKLIYWLFNVSPVRFREWLVTRLY